MDSIESTNSTDIIDSIDSILVPHTETANIHNTHEGASASRAPTKVPMGLRPIGTFILPHCVCGVNVGGLFVWHKYIIYRIWKNVF